MRLLKRLKAILTVHIPILIKTELMRLFPSLYDPIGAHNIRGRAGLSRLLRCTPRTLPVQNRGGQLDTADGRGSL